MASRLVFEDEIEEEKVNIGNGHKSDENMQELQKSSTDKGNCMVTDNNHDLMGNIVQDDIISSVLNNTQTADKGISYEIVEIDDAITSYNENNEGNPDPVHEIRGTNTNKDMQDIAQNSIQTNEGKNEQKERNVDRTEINSDNSNKMGNSEQHLESAYEVPVINENQKSKGREGGHLGQDNVMVKICPSPVDIESKGHLTLKRRLKKELELLGADIEMDNDVDGKFDIYGDDSKIYRNYRLRKTEQKISYKEPSDWKPERPQGVSIDNGPMSLKCGTCYQEFQSKRALHSHQRCHDTVLEYTCLLCSQKFKNNADLIAHKSVHNTESFLCKLCKVAFSDHCDYLLHKVQHTYQSHLTCPECGLTYNKNTYKLHITTHFNKKFNCHMCSYVGNAERNLRSHINQTHVHNKTCVECGRVFHNRKNLEYHMFSHTGVKQYQCFYCGKCFATNCSRKRHTGSHTGEKPYTCDICGHKSAQATDMKLHKITHETEKKFSCHLCGKKYFYKTYLATHMRSHTQESLYECPECDGKFVNPSGLKTHYMFKHLSERPVECSFCNKHFINNNQYRKHTKSKYHKRNMYGHNMLKNGKSE